jgi:hypothetical protein
MDHRDLIRHPHMVASYLKELEDGRLVTNKGCKIYIPTRFAERELAYVGIETQIVGIFAMTVEDKYYSIMMVNAMMRIDPTATNKVQMDGDEYYEFVFDPGATVVASTMLVQTDTLVYKIYNEIFSKGRVPWYLSYTDLGKLFDTAKEHANANIGQNQEVTELIASLIARNPANRHQYYRQAITSFEDLLINPPAVIPLRSVTFAATSTLTKLAGSYARDGLVSALVTPTNRVERIEALLRR